MISSFHRVLLPKLEISIPNLQITLIPIKYVFTTIIPDQMYTGDLWEQLLEKKKEEVRKLEEGYAAKMKERGVSILIRVLAAKPSLNFP